MGQKRTDLAGIYGDLQVVSYSRTLHVGDEFIAVWNTKCIHCGHEEERRAKNIKRAIKVGGGMYCKAPGCGLHKVNSKNASERFRNGTENISGAYFHTLQAGAKRRGKEFTISIEYLQEVYDKQGGKCNYSGVPLVMELGAKNEPTNTGSVDRIDNNEGYVEGNVQWLHKDVNFMKQAFEEDTFLDYCKLITENNNERRR